MDSSCHAGSVLLWKRLCHFYSHKTLQQKNIIHQDVDQKRGWGLQISPEGFCCRSQMLSDDALAFGVVEANDILS